jgi:glycosyltransferase involved in cell wall biosynthesis
MKITIIGKGRFHLYDLAREIIGLGFDVRLITTLPKFIPKKFGIDKSAVKSLIFVEIIERLWRYLPKFIVKKINPQFFVLDFFGKQASKYINTESELLIVGSATGLDAIRHARKIGIKTVILERGSSHIQYQYQTLEYEYKKYGVSSFITHPKVIEKELLEYQEADYISVPSTFVKNTYVQYGISEKKILLNPYGVSLTNFYPRQEIITTASLEDGVFRIIHCGTLSLRKGVQYLLQAFSRIKIPNSELLLIGSMDESFRSIYDQLKVKGVNHLGPFKQNELVKYYQSGSIFCLASIEEGLAMVIPQAMACGLPVICTDNTGGGDIVRDSIDGYVIPARNIEVLCDRIFTLYSNRELRKKMSLNALERVSHGFSWNDYGKRAAKIYYSLISEKS